MIRGVLLVLRNFDCYIGNENLYYFYKYKLKLAIIKKNLKNVVELMIF